MALDEQREILLMSTIKDIEKNVYSIKENVSVLRIKQETQSEKASKIEEQIAELNRKIDQINEEKLPVVRSDLASLKTKAAIGGALAGAILSLIIGIFLKAIDWIGNIVGS